MTLVPLNMGSLLANIQNEKNKNIFTEHAFTCSLASLNSRVNNADIETTCDGNPCRSKISHT